MAGEGAALGETHVGVARAADHDGGSRPQAEPCAERVVERMGDQDQTRFRAWIGASTTGGHDGFIPVQRAAPRRLVQGELEPGGLLRTGNLVRLCVAGLRGRRLHLRPTFSPMRAKVIDSCNNDCQGRRKWDATSWKATSSCFSWACGNSGAGG